MKIELKDQMFVINDKFTYVYSGEIHYWRIQKKDWIKHLKKAKDAGLNTVSTYIPWCIHEKEDGKIDLSSFIQYNNEVKKLGLYLISRVGPVSNAELVLEGLPKWLSEKHPEIYVKGKDLINLPHATLISYNNPTFLSYVRRWYDKILPIVSDQQITNNGNIIMVQLCNEIGMVHWLNRAIDYSDQSQKMYREYLKNKYQKIDLLNKEYRTNYTEFNELKMPNNVFEENNSTVYLDLIYFCADYYAKYYETLFNETKKHNINIPVVANIPQFYDYDVRGRGVYSPMTTLMFREFTKYVPKTIFGGAYQLRQVDYENFHDIHITTEVVKMITKKDIPSICCELQSGILRDRPRLYPNDVELNLKTSCASGLNGLNAYMFSGGKNFDGSGAFGSYHEWQAVIDSNCNKRAHFVPMKLFGEFIKSFGSDLAQTKKVYDTMIGFYAPYYATELVCGKFVDDLELRRNLFFFDGISRVLQVAGYNFGMIDIERISIEDLKQIKHLWTFSLDYMDDKTQDKLVEYVKIGGKLIIGPAITKRLSNKLGLSTDFVKEQFVYIDGVDKYVMDKVQVYEGDAGKILATTCPGKNIPCAIKKKVGSGEVLVYGFGIHHMFDYVIDIIKNWAKEMSVEQSVDLSNKDICVTLRADKEKGFLFVFNYHMVSNETKLVVNFDNGKKVRIPTIKLGVRSGQILPLNIQISDKIKINYSNVEILNYKISNSGIMFTISPSEIYECEISLEITKKPKNVKVDDEKVKFKFVGKNLKINFNSIIGLQKVKVFFNYSN